MTRDLPSIEKLAQIRWKVDQNNLSRQRPVESLQGRHLKNSVIFFHFEQVFVCRPSKHLKKSKSAIKTIERGVKFLTIKTVERRQIWFAPYSVVSVDDFEHIFVFWTLRSFYVLKIFSKYLATIEISRTTTQWNLKLEN